MSAAQRNLWTVAGPVDNPFERSASNCQAVAAALPELPPELPDPLAAGAADFSDFADDSAGLASDFDSPLADDSPLVDDGADADAAARLSVR